MEKFYRPETWTLVTFRVSFSEIHKKLCLLISFDCRTKQHCAARNQQLSPQYLDDYESHKSDFSSHILQYNSSVN